MENMVIIIKSLAMSLKESISYCINITKHKLMVKMTMMIIVACGRSSGRVTVKIMMMVIMALGLS